LVDPALERYRPLLPARARQQFCHVVRVLLEAHPASFAHLEALRRAGEAIAPGGRADASPDDQLARIEIGLGIRLKGSTRITGISEDEEVLLYRTEAALLFLSETADAGEAPRSGKASRADAAEHRRALRRFVDLALASLFAGLWGAAVRRWKEDPEAEEESSSPCFALIAALFLRFGLRDRDLVTFNRYFAWPRPTEENARELGSQVGLERRHVLDFLERLSAFVEEEAPKIERELQMNRTIHDAATAPWARAIIEREIANAARPPAKRRS
jgi:hypothetical protein